MLTLYPTRLAAAFFVCLFCASASVEAMTLSRDGKALPVIVRQAGAGGGGGGVDERAASELAEALKAITGATFEVVAPDRTAPKRAILVGRSELAEKLFPEVSWGQLGQEEIVLKVKGERLLLAGGAPRGTLYAVMQFLQQEGGVRWWTPWASKYPSRPNWKIAKLDVRFKPTFESRDPFWFTAFDKTWAVRNFSNSQSANIPEDWGGCVRYKGFVHTFFPLVPPEENFAKHPEWYSLIDGKRKSEHAQLCLSNPELLQFTIARVKQWLRESPEARIISVSQNDWHGVCQCDACKALDDAEGSHAGTLLKFVNEVAASIEKEFPAVAVDTLAYQYTRKPPKTIRPRPNVIVRLCSIECDFRESLDHPGNAAFADDIRGWAAICDRLYIWDYTTDFGHYVQPHPNWYVLGPNVRFFSEHHVRGLFEQGAYQSYGSEFGELRAWVLAQLLWNPKRDDRALIREFLDGYYGAAAPFIQQYMDLMHGASAGYKMTCFSKTDTPFHKFATLSAADALWNKAEQAVMTDAALLGRVKTARLPLGYVWLSLWTKLRDECKASGAAWPILASRKAYASGWLTVAQGDPARPGSKITLLNEGGLTPEKFVERFAEDPAQP